MTSGVAFSDLAGNPPQSPLELVAHVAGQLGENLELHQILGEIAHAARALLDIDRVSIFTLDGDFLRPTVSVSRVADDQLWATFRTMPPVSLDLSSEARILLSRGRAVEIDARVSPVVPAEWRHTFDLTYLALVPLRGANSVRGVLIGDSSDPSRARLSSEQLQALETVASLAGLVLERHEYAVARARQTTDLLTVTRALAEARTSGEIARAAAAGLLDVFDATHATVAVFDESGGLLATDAAGTPREQNWAWEDDAARCLEAAADEGHVIVRAADELVVAGFSGRVPVVVARVCVPSPDDLVNRQCALLVVDQVHHAVRRYRSQAGESQARQQLSDVRALAAAVTASGPVSDLVDRLAAPMRIATNAELIDMFIHPAGRAHLLGIRGPSPVELRRVAAWRRSSSPPAAVITDGRGLVPLVSGGKVLGALVVRLPEVADIEALEQVAAIVGPAIDAAAFRRELDDLQHRNETLDDRLRLDAKSYAAAVERLETVLALTRGATSGVTSSPARNGRHRPLDVERVHALVRQATFELASSHNAAAAAWSGRASLVGRLRALARGAARSDFAVTVRSGVSTADIELPHSSALVIAVHEILRLASVVRASQVAVQVSGENGELVLDVRADGRLALADQISGIASHVLLRSLQRQLEPFGTRVDLHNGGTWFVVRLTTTNRAAPEG